SPPRAQARSGPARRRRAAPCASRSPSVVVHVPTPAGPGRFQYDRTVLDPKVFKAYDVRGIYPTELDEGGAYAIGRAYVEQFETRQIAVGHDMRVSSPTMAKAAMEGAAAAGAQVLDL